jgi:hypothetical protein
MADRKISDLTALTTPASGDFLPIVDISEAAAASKNKRITIQSLFQGIPVNVGIGTSAPQAELHVVNATDQSSLYLDRTGGALLYLQGTANEGVIGTSGNYPLYIRQNGGDAITIDTSKRVGIGTTSPGSALEINAAVATSPFIAKINTAESARIDSSGRLLVGTSTTSQGSRAVFQGYSGDATGPGIVRLAAGSATPANATDLGSIEFSDSGHVSSARVIATRDGGAWTSGSSHPSRFVFSTTADGASSPTERMRITSSGTVNTFGSTADAFVSRSSSAAGTTNYNIRCTYSATGTLDGTVAFQVSTNGNVTNTNNSYGAISDIKLKENIVDATPQWNDIKALQVRKYNFKKGQTHTQIGLVAQEVELISPGLVIESPDCDEEGNDLGTVTKSVNYSVLYMKAVKALQEAMERIETLEAAVASLSG